MNSYRCRICNSQVQNIITRKIIDRYNINYYKCHKCSYIFTEKPYWLDEAYASVINIEDTGIIARNLSLSKVTAIIIRLLKISRRCVDYAGGYGILTRLMRDYGFDYYWHDPFCENLLARGFEDNLKKKVGLITAFEAAEHYVNPLKEFQKMARKSDNILFSTELIPEDVDYDSWSYMGYSHGQHVSLYTSKSLSIIGKKIGLNYYTDGSMVHLLTKQKFSNFKLRLIVRLRNILFPIALRGLSSKTILDSKINSRS